MPFLLATVVQVKTFLKGDVPASLDATVTGILQRVTEAIALHCHRDSWDQAVFTELQSIRPPRTSGKLIGYAPVGVSTVWVRHPPISTAPAVQLFDDPLRAYGADTLVAAADYIVEAREGRIELDQKYFSWGLQNVKIVYTGGFLTADGVSAELRYPALQRACVIQAGFEYQRRAELGLTGRSLEGGSVTTQESPIKLLPGVIEGLRSFKRVRIA
ncbi:MAG: hypothetical protein U1A73_06980 [Pseudomonas sp.]|nr:hypothetical protein [Pseudomonas sp.]